MALLPQLLRRRFPILCIRLAAVAEIIHALRILIICIHSSGLFDQLSQPLRILQHRARTQMVLIERLIVMVRLEDRAPQRIQQ